MAFRGVLLQLKEDESDAGFRVVSPDAELALPPRPVSGKEPPLTKWSQQKLVIADSVTKKLLQVARLATVMPQRDEKSVLWGVAAPFPAPEHRTVGAVPLASYKDVPDAVKSTHVPTAAASVEADASSLAAAVASTSMIATPTSVQGRPLRTLKGVQAKRLCYCFHFRSDFEYDLFARTLDAFTRMQRYALLKSSVLMEMEINYEQKQRQEQLLKLQAAANKNKVAGKKLLEVNGKPQQVKKHGTATLAQQKSKAKIATVTTPSKMVCVLCRMQRKPDGPEYPKHPFVLKDGKGEEVHTCKVCLQRVLQLRLKSSGIQAAEGGSDNYCGLCAHSTETMGPKTVKACTHEMCSRIYCATCIEKLIGKAQAHKVWRTKSWLCPNCSTLEGGAYAR
ncbi:hypothetical protein PHYBOEH_010815 [Phytophthora boehmeriae]|uniref:RING-type domain-containing protein n=1 Tax=Phytophthora boehmeriae TaxID=109152 RepID=A0A8T1VK74_9STRA|nr:hypothetical protein PHYBOEH_010815 [Phytophthora boehmeriae]